MQAVADHADFHVPRECARDGTALRKHGRAIGKLMTVEQRKRRAIFRPVLRSMPASLRWRSITCAAGASAVSPATVAAGKAAGRASALTMINFFTAW